MPLALPQLLARPSAACFAAVAVVPAAIIHVYPTFSAANLAAIARHSSLFMVLSRWEEGHIEEWSQITFPDGIVEWAEREFRRIKAKQARLLGTASAEKEVADRTKTAIQSKL